MTLRTGLFAAATAAFAIGSAQIAQSGSAYSMKMKWAKGKTYGYSLTYTVSMGGSAQPTKGGYTLTVKDVVNGIATVTAKTNVPGMGETTETFKIDAYGNVTSGKDKMNMTSLPKKAVKIGEKWSASRKLESPFPMTTKSTFTLKSIKTVNGKKYAEVSESMTGSSSGASTMSLSGSGTLLFDTADGMLYKYSNNSKVVIGKGKDQQTLPINTVVLRTK